MDSKIIKYIILFVFIFSFESKSVEFNGKFIQGHFILGKTDPGSEIEIDNKKIKVTKDGDFVFGLDRDRKNDIVITKILSGNKKFFPFFFISQLACLVCLSASEEEIHQIVRLRL